MTDSIPQFDPDTVPKFNTEQAVTGLVIAFTILINTLEQRGVLDRSELSAILLESADASAIEPGTATFFKMLSFMMKQKRPSDAPAIRALMF
jgi:hypothetical protein